MVDVSLKRLRRRHQGYSGARPDVVRLIPEPPRRVLDVGCGAGDTARMLKERYPGVEVFGVEPDAALAKLALQHMDRVIEGPVDRSDILDELAGIAPFDLILCADVLEHLIDPWSTLQTLASRISDGGHLITSLPNVRHVSTFVSLGVLGTWPMRDRGIHDRTHFRFFARSDVLALGRQAGLERLNERRNLRLFEAHPWTMVPAKLLDFWPLRAFLTFQYLHLWRRSKFDEG